ncbi:DNA-directed RNA polymerase I subunit RPA43 isoform X2 [Puntigrus tetrazona]|uniref:DNA-directed RNA polymerase I subunit RPA43 isoform X2 n=1 Tax=Puntigrus tetrazona TaxID=1606681 RepID=UPI001C8A1C3E|nr:DNA-directed RNA polymerase I subunit RPA43 isoform X2 [Puntigrus tetrazona]
MANWTQEDGAPTPVSNPADVSTAAAPVPCLVPSFADAVKLLSARYSCLVRESHRRHVALPPLYLQKKRSGIQEELNAELLKFSSSLKGVPMAYDNIKVVGQHGHIYDDQGFIHLNIEASFVVFKPRKGSKLVGVINKMGVGHVGCLVHGCFNASVVKPSLLSSEQWRESGLSVGQDLEFEVFQLDADTAGVLLIRGRLERSRVQELVARTEQKESTAESIPELESTEDTVDSPKKKKKKKKDKSEEERVDDSGDAAERDSNANGHHREKKKKKKKDEILPSDSSGYVSDKTSRKRAAESDGAGLQKKKKKKRST